MGSHHQRVRLLAGIGMIAPLFMLGAHSRAGAQDALQAVPSCKSAADMTPICGANGPEDIELAPDKRHFVVSQTGLLDSAGKPKGIGILDLRSRHYRMLDPVVRAEPGW